MSKAIEIRNLKFGYRSGGFLLRVPELLIETGSTVAVIGPSGTGKTTLLNLVAACDVPREGTVKVCGKLVSSLSDADRRDFRIRNIGLVFQEFELLSYLSVLDNILLPYRIAPALTLDLSVQGRAEALAHDVCIADKLDRPVECLSQGERQRVAVCRALVTQPSLLLCDEPTGNLDPANSTRVLDIMFKYAKDHSATLIAVTHDHENAKRFDRIVDIATIAVPGSGVHGSMVGSRSDGD
jgi:putative ABC transport system ATP-binding protein